MSEEGDSRGKLKVCYVCVRYLMTYFVKLKTYRRYVDFLVKLKKNRRYVDLAWLAKCQPRNTFFGGFPFLMHAAFSVYIVYIALLQIQPCWSPHPVRLLSLSVPHGLPGPAPSGGTYTSLVQRTVHANIYQLKVGLPRNCYSVYFMFILINLFLNLFTLPLMSVWLIG